MNKVTHLSITAARILLGLVFFVFGLNGFLEFAPPPPMPPAAGEFMGALVKSGFAMPLVKAVETGAGLLLLTNRFVPLALTLLAPVLVMIVAFHVVLAPAGLGMALFLLVLEVGLAFAHRASFAPMLIGRTPARVGRISPSPATCAVPG